MITSRFFLELDRQLWVYSAILIHTQFLDCEDPSWLSNFCRLSKTLPGSNLILLKSFTKNGANRMLGIHNIFRNGHIIIKMSHHVLPSELRNLLVIAGTRILETVASCCVIMIGRTKPVLSTTLVRSNY